MGMNTNLKQYIKYLYFSEHRYKINPTIRLIHSFHCGYLDARIQITDNIWYSPYDYDVESQQFERSVEYGNIILDSKEKYLINWKIGK